MPGVVQQGLGPARVFETATAGGIGRRTARNVHIPTGDRQGQGCPALEGGAAGLGAAGCECGRLYRAGKASDEEVKWRESQEGK